MGTDQSKFIGRNELMLSQYHQHHWRRVGKGKEKGKRKGRTYQCWFPSLPLPSSIFMSEVGIFLGKQHSTVLPLLLQEQFMATHTLCMRAGYPKYSHCCSTTLQRPSLPALPLPGARPLCPHTSQASRPQPPRRNITLSCVAQKR